MLNNMFPRCRQEKPLTTPHFTTEKPFPVKTAKSLLFVRFFRYLCFWKQMTSHTQGMLGQSRH